MSRKISWTKEDLEHAVSKSFSVADVCRELKLRTNGGNYLTIKKYILLWEINVNHFNPHKVQIDALVEYRKARASTPENTFINSESVSRSTFRRLYTKLYPPKECSVCKLGNTWNKKYLKLQIDHIDGNSNNHVLTNLRWLCPNCHSQTKTWGYMGTRKYSEKLEIDSPARIRPCGECDTLILVKRAMDWKKDRLFCSVMCAKRGTRRSVARRRNCKIDWPPVTELLKMVETTSYVQVGKKLGVSDNAVRKHIRTRSTV